MTRAPLRPIRVWSPRLAMETRENGEILVWRKDELGAWPDRVTDRLVHWAGAAPDRVWMAERAGEGWRTVSYAAALDEVRRLGQAMLDLDLSPQRPLVILSENGVDHALLALAAQHVGVPSAAVSTAFSLLSEDFGKLKEVQAQLTPGLVFAADGARYRAAIEAAFPADTPVLVGTGAFDDRCRGLDAFRATTPTAAVDRAHAAVGPDTVAKFLFTSGTTGTPKAVIQTNRTIASNQAMAADCYAFVADTPPVVCDWAPWSHTASGTKVFYLVLFNGGTYYVDAGKPAPALIGETIRNIKHVRPTWYFNVPAGYDLLVAEMRRDAELRAAFFDRLQYLMYAGAAMPRHTWDALEEMSVSATGQRVLRSSTLGATETGPFMLCGVDDQDEPGNVGIPAQGVVMKLTPEGGKLALSVKSPSITPGYWRNPELTAAAFDAEGFYRTGDALRFAVPGDPTRGFFFDGRLAENFKLATGTWVAVGPLRARLVDQLGGLARDAVIAGEGQAALGALILPFMPALRALAPDEDLDDAALLSHPAVRAALAAALGRHAAGATGSSTRVTRALFMEEPPSFDAGELTDKGSLNQRAILRRRAALVEALFSDDDPRVIRATREAVG